MKKLVPVLILAAVAGGGAYYYYTYGKTTEQPQIVQATISRGDVTEFVQATGTLEADRTVQVGPQVSGTVAWLGADFNNIVREGQVLARLDPSLLQTQVDIQTANIERQETDIASQRVLLEDSERTLQRTRDLHAKGLTNDAQLEQAELAVKTRQAQIASAEKQLVQARANMEQARLNVSYTEVRSPIDGVVVNRHVDIGQSVQSSMNITPFFTIATDLRSLRLTAGVDEADIGRIRPGMEVTFQVDTYQGVNFRGTVESVRLNATTQQNVVTYPVWISVPNPDLRLRPSLTANLRIIISTVNDVVRIPNQALRFRPTADMFASLGLTPPEPPAGGRAGGAGRGAAQAVPPVQPPATGAAPAAAQPSASAPAQQAGRGGSQQAQAGPPAGAGRAGGRGDMANLSPEERERMMAMAAAGGRAGRGGRGAGAALPPAPMVQPVQDQKIDELFAPLQVRVTPGQVWTWDEATRSLTEVRLTTGLNDGQFSQLVSGDLAEGQQVVTNIIVPITAAQSQQQSIFGQQPGRGGFGGMQPGGGGAAGRGGGGGGRGGF